MSESPGPAIEAVIAAAGIHVADTFTRDGDDGAAWVLPDSYGLADDGGERWSVIVAVTPGGDIDTLMRTAWAALAASSICTPVTWAISYGAEPVPGRDQVPNDVATVEVVTGIRT